MMDAVHRYDGYVAKSTGDGIFALFGAPVAHEDHPQRTLYASLRMQEELTRYSSCVSKDGRPYRFGSALTPVRLSSAPSRPARGTQSMYQSDTRPVWLLACRRSRRRAQSRSATPYASWSRDTSCSRPLVRQESRA
jgi:hypothetical protein